MKSASASVQKWQTKAAASSQDYVEGATTTTKDQAAAAAAAEPIYQQALQASFAKKAFSAGLNKSGKAGWLEGINEKGAANFGTGVAAAKSAQRYQTNSSKFDGARNAASALPRGAKGSPTNLNRVTAVVNALRNAKVGS